MLRAACLGLVLILATAMFVEAAPPLAVRPMPMLPRPGAPVIVRGNQQRPLGFGGVGGFAGVPGFGGFGGSFFLPGVPSGYGAGNMAQPPYYAMNPPVYYSSTIIRRPYGTSPFPMPPINAAGIGPSRQMDVEPIPAPLMIINPFVAGAENWVPPSTAGETLPVPVPVSPVPPPPVPPMPK